MLTSHKIEEIVSQKNLVLRNLQITQGYHHLAQGMRRVIGNRNINWPAFATHASKTAGYAIRQEVFPKRLLQVMLLAAGYRNTADFLTECMIENSDGGQPWADNLPAEFLTRIGRSVSEGNTIVFAELAYPFSQMIEKFSEDRVYDRLKLLDFLACFRMGPIETDGQDLLIEAFSAYHKARFTDDPKTKAELVLSANFLVGLHEQIRLQPAIGSALTTPADVLLKKKLPFLSVLPRGEDVWQQLIDFSRDAAGSMATNSFMFIRVPTGSMALSRDVQAPWGAKHFPTMLESLSDFRLVELVKQWDKDPDTLTGSGAVNWTKLEDRMAYILDMFRSHQQSYLLYDAPFESVQAVEILAGRVPAGPL